MLNATTPNATVQPPFYFLFIFVGYKNIINSNNFLSHRFPSGQIRFAQDANKDYTDDFEAQILYPNIRRSSSIIHQAVPN